MEGLSDQHIATMKDAASKLTGYKRRAFQAKATLDYCGGSARKAERTFGWGRETVTLGLHELRTGIICIDNTSARGNRKTEVKKPLLEEDIRSLAEPQSQQDPKFQSPFKYTRMTARSMRQALIDEKNWDDKELPTENTIGQILNRLGYRLRGVQKAKPLKKIKETDAIFENVKKANEASDQREDSLRISIDTKAKVDIGECSRGGKSRGAEATKAQDHDMGKKAKLVPYGILDVLGGFFTIIFGTNKETSDFIVDCLELWWDGNKGLYKHIKQLVINLDNGPHNASNRRQFIKRLIEFADKNNLEIELVYYPPYHSKYNFVERTWGILEGHWDGTLLDSTKTVLEWAKTMTWKTVRPVVELLDKVYETGVTLTKKAFEKLNEERLERSNSLPKYSVIIKPQETIMDG